MKSLADHIDDGAQVGDMFEILGFDPYASHHTFGPVTQHHAIKTGSTLELLERSAGVYIQRCRFTVNGHIFAGKSHALRIRCRKLGERKYE